MSESEYAVTLGPWLVTVVQSGNLSSAPLATHFACDQLCALRLVRELELPPHQVAVRDYLTSHPHNKGTEVHARLHLGETRCSFCSVPVAAEPPGCVGETCVFLLFAAKPMVDWSGMWAELTGYISESKVIATEKLARLTAESIMDNNPFTREREAKAQALNAVLAELNGIADTMLSLKRGATQPIVRQLKRAASGGEPMVVSPVGKPLHTIKPSHVLSDLPLFLPRLKAEPMGPKWQLLHNVLGIHSWTVMGDEDNAEKRCRYCLKLWNLRHV